LAELGQNYRFLLAGDCSLIKFARQSKDGFEKKKNGAENPRNTSKHVQNKSIR
jgi:hypothetical protein